MFIFVLRDRTHLLKLFLRLRMVRVSLKGLFKGFPSSYLLVLSIFLGVNAPKLVVCIGILVIPTQARSEIELSFLLVALVIVSGRQVEIALCRVGLPLQSHQVRVDGVVILAQHVVSVA